MAILRQASKTHKKSAPMTIIGWICAMLQLLSQVITVVVTGFTIGLVLAVVEKSSLHGLKNDDDGSGGGLLRGGGADTVDTSLTNILAKHQKLRNTANCDMPPKSFVTRIHNRFDMVVYDDDDFLSDQLRSRGWWEIEATSDMLTLAPTIQSTKTKTLTMPPPPAVLYDIGANVGYYTLLFAAAGYTVVAIEAAPDTAKLLRASLCLQPDLAARVTLLEAAVGAPATVSKPCRLRARVTKRTHKYRHSIPVLECGTTQAPLPACHPTKDVVCHDLPSTTTVDALRKEHSLPAPTLLKVDVLGQEAGVLEGAVQALESAWLVQVGLADPRKQAAVEAALGPSFVLGTERGHDQTAVALRLG